MDANGRSTKHCQTQPTMEDQALRDELTDTCEALEVALRRVSDLAAKNNTLRGELDAARIALAQASAPVVAEVKSAESDESLMRASAPVVAEVE